MDVRKIQVGDTTLVGYRSETLDDKIMFLRGTASFSVEPDERREFMDLAVGELARAAGGDFLDGYFTLPEHVARTTPKTTTDKQFLTFETNVGMLSDWSMKTRGRHWVEIERAVENGEALLQAVSAAIRKSKTK